MSLEKYIKQWQTVADELSKGIEQTLSISSAERGRLIDLLEQNDTEQQEVLNRLIEDKFVICAHLVRAGVLNKPLSIRVQKSCEDVRTDIQSQVLEWQRAMAEIVWVLESGGRGIPQRSDIARASDCLMDMNTAKMRLAVEILRENDQLTTIIAHLQPQVKENMASVPTTPNMNGYTNGHLSGTPSTSAHAALLTALETFEEKAHEEQQAFDDTVLWFEDRLTQFRGVDSFEERRRQQEREREDALRGRSPVRAPARVQPASSGSNGVSSRAASRDSLLRKAGVSAGTGASRSSLTRPR